MNLLEGTSVHRPSVAIIIPARAGSKGVPGKNLQKIGNQTLISIAVKTALGITKNVYVTSDGVAIIEEAKESGAMPILRPKRLSGDLASSEVAVIHALSTMENLPLLTVMMQCTSPFTKEIDLRQALEMVSSGAFDTVFSAVVDNGFYWTPAEGDTQQCFPAGQPSNFRPRRQDMPRTIRETGSFYVMNTSRFLEQGFRFFGKIGFVLETSEFVVDIDTYQDLELARCMARITSPG